MRFGQFIDVRGHPGLEARLGAADDEIDLAAPEEC